MLDLLLGDIFQFTELLFALPEKEIFSGKGCQGFLFVLFRVFRLFDNLMVI